ncbi:MAG: FAD-dependent oxidoreductase [Rhodospirillaceae bacterium]|nr:FAD-dependent oxidoreductase [Rhodospirillaceae bacterium]|tara:strand:- start:357 stop:1472 length:1116 start_codon:yes stop_codon:yes gene_type:complete
MHKVVVVGCGLFGSAATRHLAERSAGIICVGPDEPKNRKTHNGVFGSHYDEGRMTRVVDPVVKWAISAKNSIDRYNDIETRSGIKFFNPSGYLGIGEPKSDYNDRYAAAGVLVGAATKKLSAAQIRSKFPFLSINDNADGLLETGTAGHISPRSMIRAQSKLAEEAGASFIRDEATKIHNTTSGIEVELALGETVKAEKVLIATGGFTSACGLSPIDLNLRVFGRTVVLVGIEGALINTLSGMPTIIHCRSGAYILPPVLYPDGNTYIKLGIGTDSDTTFEKIEDLQAWFKGKGSKKNRVEFTDFIKNLMPALRNCNKWYTDTCVVTQTPTGLPIIDYVDGRKIAVAVGGNGKGAKGADEWGKIAVDLISS